LKQNLTYASLLEFLASIPTYNMNGAAAPYPLEPFNYNPAVQKYSLVSISSINSTNSTDAAINKLTEVVTAMMGQVFNLQKREPSRLISNYSNNNSNNNDSRSRIVCYNCGNPGHLSRKC